MRLARPLSLAGSRCETLSGSETATGKLGGRAALRMEDEAWSEDATDSFGNLGGFAAGGSSLPGRGEVTDLRARLLGCQLADPLLSPADELRCAIDALARRAPPAGDVRQAAFGGGAPGGRPADSGWTSEVGPGPTCLRRQVFWFPGGGASEDAIEGQAQRRGQAFWQHAGALPLADASAGGDNSSL